MNNLQIKKRVLNSIEVAEIVEKRHTDLLRDIRNYIEQLGESKIAFTDFFIESTYKSIQNKDLPCYLITKKGCEFIANKLTGIKGTIFTATYINRFNEMEQALTKPKTTMELLKLEFKVLEELETKVDKVEKDLEDFKQELPLLALDIEIIQKAKNKVAVGILGGKESPAYNDVSLRSKLYSDLNRDFKRQFNLETYKALKRNEVDKALKVIESYQAPVYIVEMIEEKNSQLQLI